MKTRFFTALVMFLCLSCSNNKPLSDSAKEKITGEVRQALASVMTAITQLNQDAITGAVLPTSEFTFTVNGNTGNYDQFIKDIPTYFTPLVSCKNELFNERYAVLDKSTVLYSCNDKCEMTFKDGKVVLQDPYAVQLLFRKKGNQWKVASWTEYGSEKIIKAGNDQKNLDQVELMRQFTGTWKYDKSKDTAFIWEVRPYGKSLAVSARTVIRGKIADEETGVFAYDLSSDKIIQTRVSKNAGSLIAPLWFTSKNTAETVFIGDMTHPDNAAVKGVFTHVSPTEMTFTIRDKDKVLSVEKYTLVRN